MQRIETTFDRVPPGWHVLAICRTKSRSWDWVALLIDTHPEDYRFTPRKVGTARTYIPGKHRNQDAAWQAFQQMCEVQS